MDWIASTYSGLLWAWTLGLAFFGFAVVARVATQAVNQGEADDRIAVAAGVAGVVAASLRGQPVGVVF